jgi:hypothetical protein
MRHCLDGCQFEPAIEEQVLDQIMPIVHTILFNREHFLGVPVHSWEIDGSQLPPNHLIDIIKTSFLDIEILLTNLADLVILDHEDAISFLIHAS